MRCSGRRFIVRIVIAVVLQGCLAVALARAQSTDPLELLRRIGDRRTTAELLIATAQDHLVLGNLDEARRVVDAALALAPANRKATSLRTVLRTLARRP